MERFVDRDLRGAEFRECDLGGARFIGVELTDAVIDGEVVNLVINGVEVSAYVVEELDRRHPVRRLLRSRDPVELLEAWREVQDDWARTVDRLRSLPPGTERVSVDGEWSALQTLRHLVFATDSWFRRGVLDAEQPFWPAGLGWSSMPPRLVAALDDDADPELDEVLEIRAGRVAEITDFLERADAATLQAPGAELSGGWPPPGHTVLECLHVVLNEEWWHHRYTVRDLDRIEAGSG